MAQALCIKCLLVLLVVGVVLSPVVAGVVLLLVMLNRSVSKEQMNRFLDNLESILEEIQDY